MLKIDFALKSLHIMLWLMIFLNSKAQKNDFFFKHRLKIDGIKSELLVIIDVLCIQSASVTIMGSLIYEYEVRIMPLW